MQQRTLSSDLTPLVKFALPVMMLLGYGFGELWSWRVNQTSESGIVWRPNEGLP